MKKFSERVSTLRAGLGISQDEFAKRLGVSRNYVSMIEQGREPSESIKKLVEVMESGGSSIVTREETTAYKVAARDLPRDEAAAGDALAACHTLLESFHDVDSVETYEFALKALLRKLEQFKKFKLS